MRTPFARALLVMVLLTAAAGLRAQPPPTFVEHSARPDFSKVEIKTTRLADDFYTLEGLGGTRQPGTVSVLIGPDGVLLVDSGKSLEEVIAAKPTASFDAQVPQSAQTAKQFIWWLYTEVKPLDSLTPHQSKSDIGLSADTRRRRPPSLGHAPPGGTPPSPKAE